MRILSRLLGLVLGHVPNHCKARRGRDLRGFVATLGGATSEGLLPHDRPEFALIIFFLVACSPQPTQTPSLVAAVATPPVVPTATPTTAATPSLTPYPPPTSTPFATDTPDPTPTPFVLTSEHPTDADVARLALAPNLPSDLLELYLAQAGSRPFFERQDVDVNGDGQSEIVLTGEIHEWDSAYIAVLGRVKGNRPDIAPQWKELFYLDALGFYCAQMRATIKPDKIIANSLTCFGGSGALSYHWKQSWIQCGNDGCAAVWSGQLFEALTGSGPRSAWDYDIATVEQPDAKTILLTTRRFGIENVPCVDCPLLPARRVIGPDEQDVYKWNGKTWDATSHEQISPGIEITREYDKSADDTSWFIERTIHESFREDCGGSHCYEQEKTREALYKFFQVPIPQSPDDIVWKTEYNWPAFQVAAKDSRGDKYAAILARTDIPSCRLAVHDFADNQFRPIGFVDVPCIDTFTHLSWADIDGDGKEELLLLTILRDETFRDVNQTLFVFRVDREVKELARISGAINGADGVGIKWTTDQEGFRLLVGLPLAKVDTSPWGFDSITLDRRFETCRWDAASNSFVLTDK